MRLVNAILLLALVFPRVACAEPEKPITDFAFSGESLIKRPFDEIRDAETVTIDDLVDTDRKAALSRIQQLPKVTTLNLYGCDLSRVDATDPVPAKVTDVLIAGGKISQGTIRWLAKFPSGTTLTFGCDVRGLDFNLGKFSWLTFNNCMMSRSAVTKLVEKMRQVKFKEVTLADAWLPAATSVTTTGPTSPAAAVANNGTADLAEERRLAALWDAQTRDFNDRTKDGYDARVRWARATIANLQPLEKQRLISYFLSHINAEPDPQSFESFAESALVYDMLANKEEVTLTQFLAVRCPDQVFMTSTEYFIAEQGLNRLQDPILVLANAYQQAKPGKNRDRIFRVLTRGLPRIVGDGVEADRVRALRRWYMRNRPDLQINREYDTEHLDRAGGSLFLLKAAEPAEVGS